MEDRPHISLWSVRAPLPRLYLASRCCAKNMLQAIAISGRLDTNHHHASLPPFIILSCTTIQQVPYLVVVPCTHLITQVSLKAGAKPKYLLDMPCQYKKPDEKKDAYINSQNLP